MPDTLLYSAPPSIPATAVVHKYWGTASTGCNTPGDAAGGTMEDQRHPLVAPCSNEKDCSQGSPLRTTSPVSTKSSKYELSAVRSCGHADNFSALRRVAYNLIPSWITTPSATTPSKTGISALDGLRGVACLFVFNEHYVICYQTKWTQTALMRIPFLRLIWYGKAAVFLFFIISGYVLSYKPLKLIRSKSYLDFQKSISSSFLRRAIRLYMPCLIVSFIVCIITKLGFFDRSSQVFEAYKSFLYFKEAPPPHLTWRELLGGYMTNVEFVFSATIPFDKDTDVNHYFMFDDHQWTIPKEFRSSLAVFALLVTTSRMRVLFRLTAVIGLALYAIHTARLYTGQFFIGMACAELDMIRKDYYARVQNSLAGFPQARSSNPLSLLLHFPDIFYKIMWTTAFVAGIWIISSPQEIHKTRNLLPDLIAPYHHNGESADNTLLIVGSVLIVWSVAACPFLGPLFNNPLVAYLGKISYALYLVHGTVIKSVGYNMTPWTLRLATWTPNEVDLTPAWWQTVSMFQKAIAYILGLCFVATTCFWLSDLFWRYVDIPSVSFARKVEGWLTRGADDDHQDWGVAHCLDSSQIEHTPDRRTVSGPSRVGEASPARSGGGFDSKRTS